MILVLIIGSSNRETGTNNSLSGTPHYPWPDHGAASAWLLWTWRSKQQVMMMVMRNLMVMKLLRMVIKIDLFF